MKNIYKKIAVIVTLLLSSVIYLSCNNEDEEFGRKDKPILSVVKKSYTVTEGEPFKIEFKLDEASKDVCEYKLVIIPDGTAEIKKDYFLENGCLSNEECAGGIQENSGPVGYLFEFPANTTEYTLSLSTIKDLLPEGTENFKAYIAPRRKFRGATEENTEIDFKITNFTSNLINCTLDWSGTYLGLDGKLHDLCDINLDLVFRDAINGIAIEYSFFNCPEVIETSDLKNVDHDIYASLWNFGDALPAPNQDIPFSVTLTKQGVFSRKLDYSGKLSTSMIPGENNNKKAFIFIGKLNRNGDIDTFTDPNGTQLEQGRISQKLKF